MPTGSELDTLMQSALNLKTSPLRSARRGCLLVLLCLWAAGARVLDAQEVVAVLSSDLAPYREAYQGFEAALGKPVTLIDLQTGHPRIGRDTRVVVAIGSKAAMEEYPRDLTLVYCMAPVTALSTDQRPGPTVRIRMLPLAEQVISTIREIQGPLRHLAVPWISGTMGDYATQMQQAGAALGIEVMVEQLHDLDELPESLRRLTGKGVEALWLPPDPLLINANSFALLREFSLANKIPLYAPTAGFAEEGAVAAVGTSFAQNGRTAAEAVLKILAGEEVPVEIYQGQYEITLNLGAAAAVGLRFSRETLSHAHRIVP